MSKRRRGPTLTPTSASGQGNQRNSPVGPNSMGQGYQITSHQRTMPWPESYVDSDDDSDDDNDRRPPRPRMRTRGSY